MVDTSLRLRCHAPAVLSPKVSSAVVIWPVLIVERATFPLAFEAESMSDVSSEKLLIRVNFREKIAALVDRKVSTRIAAPKVVEATECTVLQWCLAA